METGRIQIIDSHTAGEPTRVVVGGGPALKSASMKERVRELRESHDSFRSGVVCEPRGSDVVVGALLTEPVEADSDAAVIFFNNVGYLGMCGHGTIGVVKTLEHMGRARAGMLKIETPVGTVRAELHPDGSVSVFNVESYRLTHDATVRYSGGTVSGDVAYGGNWFFIALTPNIPLVVANIPRLLDVTLEIKQALAEQGITGKDGAEIDHVELYAPSRSADCRNFVLCPGLAYDRSPCGTGTSAKLACLAADGHLAPGEIWRQESIIGTAFEGSYQKGEDGVLPTITGRAYVMGEGTLLFQSDDPLREGIRP
jgi:4-hydroxyproline epimerase